MKGKELKEIAANVDDDGEIIIQITNEHDSKCYVDVASAITVKDAQPADNESSCDDVLPYLDPKGLIIIAND